MADLEINAPDCISCDEPAADGVEFCRDCQAAVDREPEPTGALCDACGDVGCRSPECAKQIRDEMRADADRDDPWAREERLLERDRSWRNE